MKDEKRMNPVIEFGERPWLMKSGEIFFTWERESKGECVDIRSGMKRKKGTRQRIM